MKERLKISVITATLNRKEFLKDCIESVSKSIFSPREDIELEHIIFDGGSTDGSQEFIRENYPGVKFYEINQSRGVSQVRNWAIEKASGKYIFVLDSDDVILQRTLFYLLEELEKSPNRWIFTDFIRVERSLGYIIGEDYYGWKYANCNDTLKAIFSGNHFIQHNVMFERALFLEAGGYDENLKVAEDLDLFIRFLMKDEMPKYLPIISHLHRMHESNLSIGEGGEKHLENLETLKEKHHWR